METGIEVKVEDYDGIYMGGGSKREEKPGQCEHNLGRRSECREYRGGGICGEEQVQKVKVHGRQGPVDAIGSRGALNSTDTSFCQGRGACRAHGRLS